MLLSSPGLLLLSSPGLLLLSSPGFEGNSSTALLLVFPHETIEIGTTAIAATVVVLINNCFNFIFTTLYIFIYIYILFYIYIYIYIVLKNLTIYIITQRLPFKKSIKFYQIKYR